MPFKNCSSCDGAGYIMVSRHVGVSHDQDVYEQVKRPCSNCRGSGKKWTLAMNTRRRRWLWGMNDEFED